MRTKADLMALEWTIAALNSTPSVQEVDLPMKWVAERYGDVYSAAAPALRVRASAMRAADVVDVTAELHTQVGFQCSRCAEPATMPLDTAFEHHFVGPGGIEAGEGEDFDPEVDGDPDLSEHDGQRVQLDELCIEYAILALPDVPLCKEDCLGLCPQCGHNLNEGPCDCKNKPDAFSPWNALASLKLNR